MASVAGNVVVSGHQLLMRMLDGIQLRDPFIALIIGAVLGIGASYLAALLFAWKRRPRVEMFGFVTRPASSPPKARVAPIQAVDLHKFWFRLRGREAPGMSSVQLTYIAPNGQKVSVLGKWDETPNPYVKVRKFTGRVERTFRSDMVVDTYYQPLHIGRFYTIPVIASIGDEHKLFSGWWFASPQPNPPVVPVSLEGTLAIDLVSGAFTWRIEANILDIVRSAKLDQAQSDSHQQQMALQLPSQRWKSAGYTIRGPILRGGGRTRVRPLGGVRCKCGRFVRD